MRNKIIPLHTPKTIKVTIYWVDYREICRNFHPLPSTLQDLGNDAAVRIVSVCDYLPTESML